MMIKALLLLMMGMVVFLAGAGMAEGASEYGTPVTGIIDTAGNYSSIAIDMNNYFHVAYVNGSLSYCNNTAGSWSCAIISNTAAYYIEPVIALDSSGKVHIAAVNGTNSSRNNLMYCNNTAGSWSCNNVQATNRSTVNPSIALDQSNNVHITYTAGMKIWYCNNTIGSWICSIIYSGSATAYPGYPTVAVNSSNVVHDLYKQSCALECTLPVYVKHCTFSGGSWTCENAGNFSDAYSVDYPTMTIDRNGVIHIAYYNDTSPSYTIEYCNNSVNWTCSTVEKSTSLDSLPLDKLQMDIDYNGYVHLVFLSYNNQLRYCNNRYGWSCSNINPMGINDVPSLAIRKGRMVDYHLSPYIVFSYKNTTNLVNTYMENLAPVITDIIPLPSCFEYNHFVNMLISQADESGIKNVSCIFRNPSYAEFIGYGATNASTTVCSMYINSTGDWKFIYKASDFYNQTANYNLTITAMPSCAVGPGGGGGGGSQGQVFTPTIEQPINVSALPISQIENKATTPVIELAALPKELMFFLTPIGIALVIGVYFGLIRRKSKLR